MLTESDVCNIVKDALGLKVLVTPKSNMDSIAEWDSLGHLKVLQALDVALEGKLGKVQEIASADSVQNIITILKKHGFVQ